jgi:hypothetical protein
MFASTTATVTLIVVATGVAFQIVTTARLGVRHARRRFGSRTQARPCAPSANRAAPHPGADRRRHRDYRAALRAAGHDIAA